MDGWMDGWIEGDKTTPPHATPATGNTLLYLA